MGVHTPYAVQPAAGDATINFTAQEVRNVWTAILAASNSFEGAEGVTGIGVPSGSAATGGLAVVQRGAGANGSVDVLAGHCFVQGDDITGQGLYEVWVDATQNVTVPLSPASTRNHRLVLQIEDKLSNGSWSVYSAVLSLLQDTGSGTPAQPNSALTLAIITVAPSDASVLNAAIADYRRAPGPVAAQAASLENNGGTGLQDSTQLQLWGLRHNSWYGFLGYLNYDGADQTNPGDPGGIHFGWKTPGPSNVKLYYNAIRLDSTNSLISQQLIETDTWNAWTDGLTTWRASIIAGTIHPTTTTPNNYAVLRFSQNNSSGTNTRLQVGSMLYAWPIS